MKDKGIKKLVLILTVISTLVLIINLAYYLLLPIYLSYKLHTDFRDARTIGIIGGADGPTTIYVSGSQYTPLITAIFAVLSIVGILYLVLSKRNKQNKNLES